MQCTDVSASESGSASPSDALAASAGVRQHGKLTIPHNIVLSPFSATLKYPSTPQDSSPSTQKHTAILNNHVNTNVGYNPSIPHLRHEVGTAMVGLVPRFWATGGPTIAIM